jgi:tRNA-specific 2-thiouridylase
MGRHDGVIHYTVGQRRGLGLATGEALYVVKVDAKARRVVVGPRAALGVARIVVKDMNWLGDGQPADGRPVLARVRSTRPPVPARLSVGGDGIGVVFDVPEEGVAPGQAAVLYDPDGGGSRVLGGGWILSTVSAADRR